jgi:hypothetical protein
MTVTDLFSETDTILHTKFTIGWVVNALNEHVPKKEYLKCNYCLIPLNKWAESHSSNSFYCWNN